MKLNRRLLRLRSSLKLVKDIQGHLENLEVFLPRLAALERLLENLDEIEGMADKIELLQTTVERLDRLDLALAKLDQLGQKEPHQPAALEPVVIDHEFDRLKMLSKFSSLAGKADQIQKEWQKIQQDEHDEFFKWQIVRGSNERELAYKQGITDGIKWCVERFS